MDMTRTGEGAGLPVQREPTRDHRDKSPEATRLLQSPRGTGAGHEVDYVHCFRRAARQSCKVPGVSAAIPGTSPSIPHVL